MPYTHSYVFWSFLFALLAFVISILTWIKALRIQNRQLKIEQRKQELKERQEKRAHLTAWIAKGPFYRLIIENRGAVPAVFRQVRLDGIRLNEHPTVTRPQQEEIVLGPDTTYQYKLSVDEKTPPPVMLQIIFDDEFSEDNNYRTSLSY